MPRHAKAGNLNNALLATEGEFLLILDADMVPKPEILDRTLGYFRDERMGLVQTPQYFVNVPDRRPARQPGPALLRPHPGGQGRLERRLLLRLQRRHPARGAHAARRLAVRRGGRGRRAPRAAHGPLRHRPGAQGPGSRPGRGASGARRDRLRHRPGPSRPRPGRGALRRDLPLPEAGGRDPPRAGRRRPALPATRTWPSSPASTGWPTTPTSAWPRSTSRRCSSSRTASGRPSGPSRPSRRWSARSTSTWAARPSR